MLCMLCRCGLQRAVQHLDAAAQDLDIYRRQWLFPKQPHRLLCALERSALSTTMGLVYALQPGRLRCTLCR